MYYHNTDQYTCRERKGEREKEREREMKTVGVTACQADVGTDMILIDFNDDVWILMARDIFWGECVVLLLRECEGDV